ncbi:MAG: hypothetical protein WBB98_15255 [Xanthobacteraceae bacterium]
MVAEFPRALLREKSHSWNLAGNTMTPGQTGSGVMTVGRSDGGGYWTCAMGSVALAGRKGMGDVGRDRQKFSTLLWRAVRQICAGGVNLIVVPRNDALFRPFPDGAKEYGGIRHSDGSAYSDSAGYYQPVISVMTYAAASLRATTLGLELVNCAPLVGGESFSINHPNAGWRLYEIATVEYIDDNHVAVTFNPPLREAVLIGTEVEFDCPRCTMRLANAGAMDLAVAPWTFNTADANFVEGFA